MNINWAINELVQGNDLASADFESIMTALLSGELDDIQIAGFLVALRAKGESVEDINSAVAVLRSKMTSIEIVDNQAVDIVGTGGDGSCLFNVSTAASFVASAANVTIAKHGNRSVSSNSGAADVLAAMGVDIELKPEQVAQCINQVGIGFMFAPTFHAAMRFVMPARNALGIRTLFNILGPLCNPAKVKRQVLGTYSDKWLLPMAQVLQKQGAKHVMLIHSEDGLDEISLAAPTSVVELKNNSIRQYHIKPEQFGIKPQALDVLKVTDATESLAMIRAGLNDSEHPAAKMIALNAGAAIYVSGKVSTIEEGVKLATTSIQSGLPLAKIQALADFSCGQVI